MGLDVVYRKSPASITSYDYVDIASGTGQQAFYLASCMSGASLISGGILVTNTGIYSNEIAVTTTSSSTTSRTFDLKFNLPRIVNGDALLNIPFATVVNAGNVTSTVFAELDIISGGVSTFVVSGQTVTVTSGGSEQTFGHLIRLPISNLKIKKNDIIRLNVDYNTAIGTGRAAWGIDPANRTWATVAQMTVSRSALTLPFVIDVY